MPRVLLLATTTGYQTRAFGEGAERLGVDLVFATDRCDVLDDPWRDRAIPIRFSDEAASAQSILELAGGQRIDGVLVVGDRPTLIAALVQEGLGLPGHPPAAVQAARHKLLTRERLGALAPSNHWYRAISLAAEPRELAASVSFPCVLKPLALSGSRGVMRVDNGAELVAAVERLRTLLGGHDLRGEPKETRERALLEKYVDGREFAVEGLMNHGTLHVLAIFDKPDALDGPFFEETLYLAPSMASPQVQRGITSAVGHAAHALGLRHGPVHAECRVSEAGVFVLEVAARPIGGLCARALRFEKRHAAAAGGDAPTLASVSLEELLLTHALGESSEGWTRERAASGVMMIPIPRRGLFREVSGLDAARRTPFIDELRITAKADQLLLPLPEGASYLGFIFARAEAPAQVEQALRTAHARLEFVIDPELRVLQSAHG